MRPTLKRESRLGHGTYGRVYSATDGKNSFAVKRNFTSVTIKETIGILRELDVLNLVKGHPFLIQLKGVMFESPFPDGSLSPSPADLFADKTYILLEKGDRDGDKYLHETKFLLDDRKLFMVHLLLAIEFLHSRKLYHRDVKPANIICFLENGRLVKAQLADFGMTQPYTHQSMSMPGVITLWYRAPEMSLTKDYDYKVDVWGAGCIFFEAFHSEGRKFVEPATDEALINALIERLPFSKEDHHLAGKLYVDKINIQKSYETQQQRRRPLGEQLGSHTVEEESLQLVANLLEKMLVVDPKNRWTISQCLNHSFFNSHRALINKVRTEFQISAEGTWVLSPDPILRYISSPAREKAMFWFKNIYASRLDPPIFHWYSHRILFHAIEMMDRYLEISGITSASDGDVAVWINTFLFMSAKYFRILIVEFGLNHFAIGIIPEQLNLFKQKAQSFEEHVVKDLFKYQIYRPTLFEASDDILTETSVAHLIRIIVTESAPSGISLERLLIREQQNITKLNRTTVPLSSGQTPVVSLA